MLNVKPLAFDSFGVRSMATFVATDDIAVLIDPGVSLASSRYKLPPHPIEEQRLSETWADIKEHATRSYTKTKKRQQLYKIASTHFMW